VQHDACAQSERAFVKCARLLRSVTISLQCFRTPLRSLLAHSLVNAGGTAIDLTGMAVDDLHIGLEVDQAL
jgi:hypothetical protein